MRDTLLAIRANDPAGQETEPTREDYERFESWILNRYGANAMHTYYATNWDAESAGS